MKRTNSIQNAAFRHRRGPISPNMEAIQCHLEPEVRSILLCRRFYLNSLFATVRLRNTALCRGSNHGIMTKRSSSSLQISLYNPFNILFNALVTITLSRPPLEPSYDTMPPKPGSTKVRKKPNKPRDVPFPSPTGSDGPPVPPPRPDLPRAISELVHSGLPGFNIDPLPIGFPAEYNMCYRNAALSLLVNVAPFVGYLDQFSLQTRNTNENVLIELGDMATAYWSQDSEEQRRERLRPIIDKLWAHLLCLNYDNRAGTVGWGPFLDSTQREMQQDAGDFLENLLVNADGECDQGR